jgi:hypothetical protein
MFMRTFNLVCVTLTLAVFSSQGQNVQNANPPPDSPYAVVEKGANYRVWEKTKYERRPDGTVVPHIHKYTEMATGMYYQENGGWVESKELIEPSATGATAQQGKYRVNFANNINTTGSIDQQTSDGKRLRSNILGLDYYDSASGKIVLIAQIKDSQGKLTAPNKVLYEKAFTGVNADVQYTYKKGKFEQDVILREQPPTPESYGLNSESTVLEVITEFIDPPAARMLTHPDRNSKQTIDTISWGAMQIVNGKAFLLNNADDQTQMMVTKQYMQTGGRQILLEQVPVPNIAAALATLPLQSSRTVRLPTMVAFTRMLPPRPLAQAKTRPIRIASAKQAKPGYVLDYVELCTDQGDFTFQGDTTYYINGGLYFSGNVIFEGGTVIKYTTSSDGCAIALEGSVACDTAPYQPAVFTSVNDDTVGEPVDDYTLPLYYYYNAIQGYASSSVVWHDISMKYALYGLDATYLQAYDCQFVDCVYPLVADLVPGATCSVTNVLVVNAGSAFLGTDFSAVAYQLTVDNCTNLVTDYYSTPYSTLAVTNSLLVNVQDDGDATVTSDHTADITDTTGSTFQVVGGGSCYLANDSLYHGAGTLSVDPVVLADIAGKTTHPPTVYADETISAPLTLSPDVPRDNSGNPDLGYHYNPLDYVFGGVGSSVNLNFTAGTAVGWYNDGSGEGYGISLNGSAQATFAGTATAPCVLAKNDMVQEGGTGNWDAESYLGGFTGTGGSDTPATAPTLNLNFTRCYSRNFEAAFFRDNGDGTLFVTTANNSEFYDSSAVGYVMYFNFTNCLAVRASLGANSVGALSVTMRNCTFFGGSLAAQRSGELTPVMVEDCAFAGTDFSSMDDPSGGDTNVTWINFNSYLPGDSLPPGQGAHYVTVTDGYNWQSSWFGDYYLPSTSPLITAGSTTANLIGLYHFTTQTSQTPEGDAMVDIGYHYVATDADGNPLDTNGDGIPDYLEDSNGDGIYDTGDLADWLSSGTVTTSAPLDVFTPLKN